MSRDAFPFDPLPREEDPGKRDPEPGRAAPRSGAERLEIPLPRTREPRALTAEREGPPRAYSLRDRTFLLRESELHTMAELGTFRVVAATELARLAYASDHARMEHDVRRLKRQSLLSEQTLAISGRKTLRVLTLTKTGKRVLENAVRLPEDQRIYHGIARPREAEHDAELYRLFHTEADRIERDGGKLLRVLLDYELKSNLNRDRAKLGDRSSDPQEIKRLARRHGLTVVDGKTPLPDMRIEYQTAELELRRVDLELATRHYRPRGVAEKAKAGFSLYSHREDASRLRRILDGQELASRILLL
ncbi:MAG TPA: hypothetical protein VK525_03515 [Candidatus Saccharimonadales bacterium]|nr:hypothetical protein [Candidatus Saccharimonadales bacterium]